MLFWILEILLGLFVLLTLLPLSTMTVWWVRGVDFPRVQILVFGLIVLLVKIVTGDEFTTVMWITSAAAAACVVYQAVRIFPYTPISFKEVKQVDIGSTAERLCIMSVNILMTNRRVGDLLRIVAAKRPDVLVTLETNSWWEQQLSVLERDYPHRLRCPLENFYGMHVYSRFPLEDPKIQFLVEREIPSMHLLIVLPSERRVRLHFIHPAPPSPTENPTSKERDAELVMVGRSVVDSTYPVIVSGDLNDVAWSATTRLFRKVSGLLDPRIGRGMYNTFHAKYPFMRWPVDHFFHSAHFKLARLERLEFCGSDHFPVLVELALDEEAVSEQKGLEADASDVEEAREKMQAQAVSSVDVHRPGRDRVRAKSD